VVRDYCFRCRRTVGSFLKPIAWQCPKCWNIFCEDACPKKVGIVLKKPLCPECKIDLAEDGVRVFAHR
jgi:hypothetical protein